MSDPAPDLRSFLELVARTRRADYVEVTREVSPRYETAAILTALEAKRRSPLLVFRNVTGTHLPVVTNVGGSMGRLALALGCALPEVGARFEQAAAHRHPPVETTDAPVHEVVLRGSDVDLGFLPSLVYHADDTDRPYLTAAMVVARDPHSGVQNLSYHRMMIAGPTTTGIYMEPGRHLHGIHQAHVALGRPMPIAVVLGVHPAITLGALYAGRADEDEYEIIGGLLGQPLPVTRTVTGTNLLVPAAAEIVLEGAVSIDETIPEGPFGEFTGYGTGPTRTPVFHVEAITHRTQPYFQDIVSGNMEHLLLSLPALEHRTLRDARAVAPGVRRIALPAPLTAIVSLAKQDDDEPRRVIEALLGDIYAKHVIIVDADVDPSDLREVMVAIALQTQADTKVHVFPDRQGTPLDPSAPTERGRTAKMGIDATRPLAPARAVTRNRIPPEVLDSIDLAQVLGRK
ncbi:UbiD family decarboxylase [Paraliomyxa miuraensis]|uniref:UbiD family decarboxylase n=1 Tax=Paraliomyxa miuraensis TaxID=376150 RepID=UPI00225377CC|nr:UbiD family decarboxylase [Paraliomyxa miuraensis]MCX4240771.1 UbiD family decarboxylase [Paraliomyxa miuraensis]